MRFPWLQVEMDFLEAKAGDLGAILGISRREAVGLVCDLWAWVLKRADSDAPPDGIVRDSRTGTGAVELVERAGLHDGPSGSLVDALLECGLVERRPDGLRFRGLGRYAKTWEKNKRRKSTGAKPERNRSGTGDKPAPKTYTETYTQKEETTFPLVPSEPSPQAGTPTQNPTGNQIAVPQPDLFPPPAPVAKRGRPPKPRAEKAPDPRHHPLKLALIAEFSSVSGRNYTFLAGRDAAKVSELLGFADQDQATSGERAMSEVVRRWRIGLRWRWGNGEAPVQSLSDLVRDWNKCGSEATAPPPSGTIPPHLMRKAETHMDELMKITESRTMRVE